LGILSILATATIIVIIINAAAFFFFLTILFLFEKLKKKSNKRKKTQPAIQPVYMREVDEAAAAQFLRSRKYAVIYTGVDGAMFETYKWIIFLGLVLCTVFFFVQTMRSCARASGMSGGGKGGGGSKKNK
jgi:hypothetical protein